jgi:hypothetical protein
VKGIQPNARTIFLKTGNTAIGNEFQFIEKTVNSPSIAKVFMSEKK